MQFNVLDKGYVRYVDHMGSDLTVVNAARASFKKESKELTDKDIRLIRFLAREKHESPFRHPKISFEIKAPLMVARQWWKHVVDSAHIEEGSSWNEASMRYITVDTEFYVPSQWRAAPEHKKQGSGGPVEQDVAQEVSNLYQTLIWLSESYYKRALELGVAPEQARLFLPAYAVYTTWRWTASLQAVFHFIELRQGNGAQEEIRQYADAVSQIVKVLFPISYEAWFTYRPPR